jgi:hypothetical protein
MRLRRPHPCTVIRIGWRLPPPTLEAVLTSRFPASFVYQTGKRCRMRVAKKKLQFCAILHAENAPFHRGQWCGTVFHEKVIVGCAWSE